MNDHVSSVEGAILGLLQGVTEFLPVSSSGHLAAHGLWFGEARHSLGLIVLLHTATLAATLLVFAGDLRRLLHGAVRGLRDPTAFAQTPDGKLLLHVIAASVPTAVLGLALKSTADTVSGSRAALGICFVVTAAALLSTRGRDGCAQGLTLAGALGVGAAQGLAVLPGLSRSGLTIAAAIALGMEGRAAFRFSFLLSIPAIVGATLLELSPADLLVTLPPGVWVATAVTFLSGWASLLLLRRVVSGGRFWMFALYLIPLGLLMLAGAMRDA